MRRALAILPFLVVALAARAQERSPDDFADAAHFRQHDGAALYRAVCQGCHMPEGLGAVGAGAYPKLAKDPHLEQAGYPVTIVLTGHDAMPPLGRLLDDDQVAAVVNYVRTHFGNTYKDQVVPADVAAARH